MEERLISSACCVLTFFFSQFVCFLLQETEKARAVREMEERLISSAFYNLSMQMHRSTVEARLSNIHSTSSPHGQSFLARQRWFSLIHTRSPCLMRMSLLLYFKRFYKYLADAIFGQIPSLLRLLGYFGQQIAVMKKLWQIAVMKELAQKLQ